MGNRIDLLGLFSH